MLAMPLIAPIDRAVSCLLGHTQPGHTPLLFVGCTNGDILMLRAASPAEAPLVAAAGTGASTPGRRPLSARARDPSGGGGGGGNFSGGVVGGSGGAGGGAGGTCGCGGGVAGAAGVTLQLLHRMKGAHDGAVTALHVYEQRGLLVSGGADSVICVWRLPPRDAVGGGGGASGAGGSGGGGGGGETSRATPQLLGRLGGRPSASTANSTTSPGGGPSSSSLASSSSAASSSASVPPPPPPPPVVLGAISHISAVPVGGGGAPRVLAAASSGIAVEWDLHGGSVCRRLGMPGGLQALARDAMAEARRVAIRAPSSGRTLLWHAESGPA